MASFSCSGNVRHAAKVIANSRNRVWQSLQADFPQLATIPHMDTGGTSARSRARRRTRSDRVSPKSLTSAHHCAATKRIKPDRVVGSMLSHSRCPGQGCIALSSDPKCTHRVRGFSPHTTQDLVGRSSHNLAIGVWRKRRHNAAHEPMMRSDVGIVRLIVATLSSPVSPITARIGESRHHPFNGWLEFDPIRA